MHEICWNCGKAVQRTNSAGGANLGENIIIESNRKRKFRENGKTRTIKTRRYQLGYMNRIQKTLGRR